MSRFTDGLGRHETFHEYVKRSQRDRNTRLLGELKRSVDHYKAECRSDKWEIRDLKDTLAARNADHLRLYNESLRLKELVKKQGKLINVLKENIKYTEDMYQNVLGDNSRLRDELMMITQPMMVQQTQMAQWQNVPVPPPGMCVPVGDPPVEIQDPKWLIQYHYHNRPGCSAKNGDAADEIDFKIKIKQGAGYRDVSIGCEERRCYTPEGIVRFLEAMVKKYHNTIWNGVPSE